MTPTKEQLAGQHGSCETIKVKSGDSYAIINTSDFDPKKHEEFVADVKKEDVAGDKKEEKKGKK
jgi:hypothetical protein